LSYFLEDCRGVTAIEYGLMIALMTLVIVGAVNTLGNQALTQLFEVVANSM
jgi:Flp pilus assembly pilin Flp